MQRLALFFALTTAIFTAALFACSSGGSGKIIYVAADARLDTGPLTAGDDGGSITPPPASESSCNLQEFTGYCLDYTDDKSGQEATQACYQENVAAGYDGGASETDPCPTDNRVGSCATTLGGVATTYRYYSPKYTTETAQADCATLGTGGGTFTAN